MIYKEITLSQALQLVAEDNIENLYLENSTGLVKATEVSFYFKNLKARKWFRRIPKENELPKG